MTVTTPLGQVLNDEDGMRLEFVRTYDNTVEDVWSALTEPDRVARWLGTWTGDPATGMVELLMSEDHGSALQAVTILECRPPTRLVVDLPSPDGTWRLSVSLRAQAGVTTLVFTQRLTQPYDARSIGPGLVLLPGSSRCRRGERSSARRVGSLLSVAAGCLRPAQLSGTLVAALASRTVMLMLM